VARSRPPSLAAARAISPVRCRAGRPGPSSKEGPWARSPARVADTRT
jgi:hypothetical protein